MYADAHCHLADPRMDSVRDQVLERARRAGIGIFVQGGVDPRDWQRQLELAQSGLHATFGLHPWFVAEASDEACDRALQRLPEFLPKAVALGELGLDYLPRFDPSSHPRQKRIFSEQLEMADNYAYPLVLHIVRAHGDALKLLRSQKLSVGGLVHGFAASYEIGKQYLDLGFTLSIGTGLLQKGYRKLKDAVGRLPLDRLVVESDAPDGNVPDTDRAYNEPTAILAVAAAIADLHQTTPEAVLEQSTRRVCEIFSLEC